MKTIYIQKDVLNDSYMIQMRKKSKYYGHFVLRVSVPKAKFSVDSTRYVRRHMSMAIKRKDTLWECIKYLFGKLLEAMKKKNK